MGPHQSHLDLFKSDLRALPLGEVYNRHIAHETCRGLLEVDESSLRQRIADHFGINKASIFIVGSAKLGFTIRDKPAKYPGGEMRPMFSPFSDASDVDIAIVSDRLFDEIWKGCFSFWHTSGYGNSSGYWTDGRQFRDYFFRGWMRPDKLPSEGSFRYRDEWFDFFRKLTSARAAGSYKITAGLYRESYFLESYQQVGLSHCRAAIGGAP